METYLNNNYENLNNALSSFQPEHCIFDHEEQISYQKPVSKQNSPKKINSIRTSLLLIADKEMTVKVKDNKDFKINSEIPKIVSSGVFEINYKEIIEFNSPSKEYKQERSAVTSKLNRIYLEADININPTVNIVDQFDIMQHKIQKLNTTSFTNPEKFSLTQTLVPEICNNGLDDDGDGLIDCQDPDCTDCSCNSYTGNITFTNTGNNNGPAFTTKYTLTNAFGVIQATSNITSFICFELKTITNLSINK